jgi:hypothetical protein
VTAPEHGPEAHPHERPPEHFAALRAGDALVAPLCKVCGEAVCPLVTPAGFACTRLLGHEGLCANAWALP